MKLATHLICYYLYANSLSNKKEQKCKKCNLENSAVSKCNICQTSLGLSILRMINCAWMAEKRQIQVNSLF